jgi:beta-glucosidase
MGWEIYPSGLGHVIDRLAHEYRAPTIYVTENGAAFPDTSLRDGRVDDGDRIAFMAAHLEQVAAAIRAGIDVAGYFAWTLLDNFEWAHGYSKRFGIVRVDHDTDQRRTPKASAEWYAGLIRAWRDGLK